MGTTVSRTSMIRTGFLSCREQSRLAELQQRPKLSNVAHTFEMKHSLDQARAFCRAEDGCNEVTGLGDDFFTSHRIFGGATNVINALGEMRPVRQRHIHNGHS